MDTPLCLLPSDGGQRQEIGVRVQECESIETGRRKMKRRIKSTKMSKSRSKRKSRIRHVQSRSLALALNPTPLPNLSPTPSLSRLLTALIDTHLSEVRRQGTGDRSQGTGCVNESKTGTRTRQNDQCKMQKSKCSGQSPLLTFAFCILQ